MSNRQSPDGVSPQKHAIVTGASSGIGRAIAVHLLDMGWRVTGVDRSAPTLSGADFSSLTVELGMGPGLEQAAAALDDADALIHAAGVLRVGTIGELDHLAGEMMWRLHVDAASRLCNLIVPAMVTRGNGRVVFIGSRVAQGMPGRAQYASTKAALIAMARSWASETAKDGVTFNVISPAATATGMLHDSKRVGSAPQLPPIGRLIEPVEIAQLAGYLLSDAASAITGQDIAICGGASLPR